ncbi:hypothetical protein HK096_006933, partial [Nowakowskiella sp. JEL0078]
MHNQLSLDSQNISELHVECNFPSDPMCFVASYSVRSGAIAMCTFGRNRKEPKIGS